VSRPLVLRRRQWLGAGGAALLAPLLAGCESLRGVALPEVPVWVHRPGGVLSIAFRRQLTDKNAVQDQAYERGRPAIDPQHLRVFVPSQDGGLYAVDARSGDVLYRSATTGPVQCEPLYDPSEDVVYFGSIDGALYKIRAADGKLLYRFASNGEVARRPVIEGSTVFLVNANDTLLAIDRATGKLKYYQKRQPAFGIEIGAMAGPVVTDGKVITAFSDGAVMAYALGDGAEVWPTVDLSADTQAADGQPPQYLDVDTTPVPLEVAGSRAVAVGHYEGGVYALDVDGGRILWKNADTVGVTHLLLWDQPAHASRPKPNGQRGPDAPRRRILVAASGRTGLWGLDPDTGTALWRRKLPEGGISAPVPVAGALLVSTTRYGVFLVEPTRGGVIDGIEPGNEIAMTPAAHGNHAYVMTNGGELLAIVVHPPVAPPKRKA
jgi:outer membrane protein assembly factor BamB